MNATKTFDIIHKIDNELGDTRVLTLPYSEVNMSMRVAGKTMVGRLTNSGMVQLYDENERPFSAPITRGEAGWL